MDAGVGTRVRLCKTELTDLKVNASYWMDFWRTRCQSEYGKVIKHITSVGDGVVIFGACVGMRVGLCNSSQITSETPGCRTRL